MDPKTLLSSGAAIDDHADPVATIEQLLQDLPKELTQQGKLDAFERCASLLARAPLGSVDVFAPPIRRKLGVTKDTLILKVQQVRAAACGPGESATPAYEPSAEDLQRAEELILDSRIIDRFVSDMARLGVVGETLNLLLLLLTMVSRLLRRPISIAIKGASSVGKSFLLTNSLDTLPRDQYVVFTAASAKALYFRTESLKHKILAFMERPGAEGSDYQVRVLQSEGHLVYSVAEKDPDTGQIVAVDKVIEGPVAYIETTTQTTLHDENETRSFSISLDESQEATAAILLEQGRQAASSVKEPRERILSIWQAVHTLLRPADVVIPFAESLAGRFPSKLVRARRDFPRFLALVEASVLLHQHQRERNAHGALIATVADYALARRLARPLLETAIHGATEKTRQLVVAARGLAEAEASTGSVKITATKLTKHLPSSGWSKTTIRRHLKAAEEAGYLDLMSAKRGEDSEYQIAQVNDGDPLFLPTSEELETEANAAEVRQAGQGAPNANGALNHGPLNQIAEVRQPDQGVEGDTPRLDFDEDSPSTYWEPDL